MLNERDANGRNTLHLACKVGNEVLAMALLDAGADPSIKAFDKKNAEWLTAKDLLCRSGRWFS